MKICLVTGEYPPKQGGVGDYTHELARALAGLGQDTHVLTTLDAAAKDASGPGQPCVHRPVRRWDWSALKHAANWVWRERPDVVHIQYQTAAFAMHPAANCLPWWLQRRLGRAAPHTAVTFHDVKIPYLFPKAGPVRDWVTRLVAHSSDAVIVTNIEDQLTVRAWELKKRLHMVPIGSNIAPDLPPGYQRDAQRARRGISPDEIVLCYFGFLNESKGGESLVRALDILVRAGHNVRLLMIGGRVGSSDPTNEAYATHIDELIARHGLSQRVVWTGFSEASDVSADLMAADICVLPYRDGASFRRGSFMAALAHARPIVSTEPRVPIVELRPGENILLAPPNDAEALAKQVETLIGQPELRAALGDGAAALSRQFDWHAIARRTLEVYRGLGA